MLATRFIPSLWILEEIFEVFFIPKWNFGLWYVSQVKKRKHKNKKSRWDWQGLHWWGPINIWEAPRPKPSCACYTILILVTLWLFLFYWWGSCGQRLGKEFAQSRTMNEWHSLVWNLGAFDGEPRALSTEQLGHATVSHTVPEDSYHGLRNNLEFTEQRQIAKNGEKQVRGRPTTCSWKAECLMGKQVSI